MKNNLIRWAGFFGFLSVALGAFGAHGLESQLGPSHVDTFQTGVRYQFFHALALLFLATLIPQKGAKRLLKAAAWCFIVGIIAFSGSLYFLSTRPISGWALNWLGPVTPIGGLFFITGWILLFLSTFFTSPKGS